MIYQDRLVDPMEKKARKTTGPLFSDKAVDTSILRTIAYEYPGKKITVEMVCDEFTCVCPFSGLPDFARITLRYVPRRKLIEMKSLKYYFYAFRNVRIYNEHAVSRILRDLQKVLNPIAITLTGSFSSRGGITNTVTAEFKSAK